MSKVRVYEIAKQLNMDQKSVVAHFQSMGIGDVRNHMSAVEADLVDRLKRQLERQKSPDAEEVRISAGVVKRRRPADASVPSARPSGGGALSSPQPSPQVSDAGAASDRFADAARSRPGVPAAAPSQGAARSAIPTPSSVAGAARGPSSALQDSHRAQDDNSNVQTGVPGSAPSSRTARTPDGRAPEGGAVEGQALEPSSMASSSRRAAASRTRSGAKVGSSVADSDFDMGGESVGVDASQVTGGSERGLVARGLAGGLSADANRPAEGGDLGVPSSKAPSKSGRGRVGQLSDVSDSGAMPSAAASQTGLSQPGSASIAGGNGTASAAQAPAALASEAAEPPASRARPSRRGADVGRPDATPRSVREGAASPSAKSEGAQLDAEPPPPTQVSPARAESVSGGHPQSTRMDTSQPGRVPPPQPAIDVPKRPSSPPRTGIDVWGGRPGVPMPPPRALGPQPRRTTYDPRATAAPARTGPTTGFMGNRPGGRPGQRPGGFGHNRFARPGQSSSSASKRPPTMMEMAAHKKVIKIEENVSLQKLAMMMSLKVTDVLMKLLSMGMTGVNINSSIDADTAKILASEFGWTVEDVAVSEEASIQAATGLDDKSEHLMSLRPPIVTVMGHVDHGKTSLLDRIRRATVAAGEAGGITQHIGAYRVETSRGTIAFLDTPGHEAFTAMRARGAQVTDVVVLVVAADDGVMPQTKEAINHATAAKVPIIVAVNKMDKPSADLERVKRDLSNFGLNPEEWGGTTLFCPVSALTGEGIDELLDAIVLQSEVLELNAAPQRRAHGVVIEALLDCGRGPVARVMVQDGTLRAGDYLLAGSAWGKVRAMTDEFGRTIAAAGPATPVEVLGLNEVPSAGDPVHAVKDAKTAEEIAEGRRKKANKSLIPQDSRVSLETLKERLAEGEQLDLKLIIKGDVQGSVEAVAAALIKLNTPKVKVTVVHAAVGAITEGDVNLAIASKAIVVGFNVRPAGKASQLAEGGAVEIRLYTIIYNAVDDIRAAMEGLLPTTKLEKALGTAEVRKVFKITKVGTIAGCLVTSGLVRRGADARLVRDSVVVFAGKIGTLKRIKDDAREVAEGLECGIGLENFNDIKEGDVIEAFDIEEVKQKLA